MDQRVTLFRSHIEARRFVAGVPGRSRLGESRHFQAKLAGAGLKREIAQRGGLSLPSEAAHTAISQPCHPTRHPQTRAFRTQASFPNVGSFIG